MKDTLPQARSEDLLILELSDETLIYDNRAAEAHCLNSTASAVWKACDGQTSFETLASQSAVGEIDALQALEELSRRQLLVENADLNSEILSRRTMLGRFGIAAASITPFIVSVTAPPSVAAQSCETPGPQGPQGPQGPEQCGPQGPQGPQGLRSIEISF